MTVAPRLQRIALRARRRRAAIIAAFAVPIVIAVAAVAARAAGLAGALGVVAAGMSVALVVAIVAWRRLDDRWFVRHLDASAAEFEDSSALLLAGDSQLRPLQRLQRERVVERLERVAAPDLREPWPRSALIATGVIAFAIVLAGTVWPPRVGPTPSRIATDAPTTRTPAASHVTSVSLEITPPAYTSLPVQRVNGFEASVPEGASLRWRVRLDVHADDVALRFHDGVDVSLQRDGDEWVGTHVVTSATLYRVVPRGTPPLADDRLHRLDVIADAGPELRVELPDRTLTLLTASRPHWDLRFDASDDYGIAGADLALTLAQGSGENIAFSERNVALAGAGSARERSYRHRIDLAALGFAVGDDVIVRLRVRDNRPRTPNVTRSASFILRWPPDTGAESSGMDGLVRTALPAFFRSQRQIIIDTEALIARRGTIDADAFAGESDALGVDQKVLRLRYGQFLGEEFETRTGEPPSSEPHDEHETQGFANGDDDDEREAMEAIASYGHTHDEAEAATLLDPATKKILRAALDQMWQAELQLRLGEPAKALPYENKALEYVKQVQQSTRIYLARVGLELPAIDESRRLIGDRSTLRDRRSALVAATRADDPVTPAWQALTTGATVDWDAFERSLRARTPPPDDLLGVIAAIDTLRREPDCADCRDRARRAIWPLLPRPPAQLAPRTAADAAAQAYLDALGTETAQ